MENNVNRFVFIVQLLDLSYIHHHPGFACLAETALLAMEGRFESFTIGRDLSIEKIQEIYALFLKHKFPIAPLRSFGEPLHES